MKYLFIDDDATTNFMHGQLLEILEIKDKTEIMHNPEQALTMLESLPVDELPKCIFLDIKMPEMDGFDFLRELEESDSELAETLEEIDVYVLTSSTLMRDRELTARFPNVKGFLEKPLSKQKLQEIVQSYQ